jgi:hypothetical protein
MEFSPNGDTLAVFSDNGGLVQWNTADWSVKNAMLFTELALGIGMDYSRDGDVLMLAGQGPLIVIDADSGARLFTRDFGVTLWGVSLNGEGTRFALGTDDGQIHIVGLD